MSTIIINDYITLSDGTKIHYKDMLKLCEDYHDSKISDSIFPTIVAWDTDVKIETKKKENRLHKFFNKLKKIY